jgi:hypothetical protein
MTEEASDTQLPTIMASIQDDAAAFRNVLMARYREMIDVFRQKMWLAEPETRECLRNSSNTWTFRIRYSLACYRIRSHRPSVTQNGICSRSTSTQRTFTTVSGRRSASGASCTAIYCR